MEQLNEGQMKVGTVLTGKDIRELPLEGWSVYSILLTAPDGTMNQAGAKIGDTINRFRETLAGSIEDGKGTVMVGRSKNPAILRLLIKGTSTVAEADIKITF